MTMPGQWMTKPKLKETFKQSSGCVYDDATFVLAQKFQKYITLCNQFHVCVDACQQGCTNDAVKYMTENLLADNDQLLTHSNLDPLRCLQVGRHQMADFWLGVPTVKAIDRARNIRNEENFKVIALIKSHFDQQPFRNRFEFRRTSI